MHPATTPLSTTTALGRNTTPSTSTTTLYPDKNMGTKTLEMVDRLVPLQHMGKTSLSPLSATNREGGPTNREHHARLSLSLSLSVVVVVVVVVVFLTLIDPLRIQPWSQYRRNETKSNRESKMSREKSRQKRTDKKVASKGNRRDKIENTNKKTQTVETN